MNNPVPVQPVPALIPAVIEYRVRCDITYFRPDGTTYTIECTAPISYHGRNHTTFLDLDSAEAGLECAIEAGEAYEEHVDHMHERFPEIYDRLHMHNYRLVRRECTEWHM